MTPFDFTHIIPDDPDPLKAAEDRVAEAAHEYDNANAEYEKAAAHVLGAAPWIEERRGRARQEWLFARADLAALRAKLAAEADAPLPFSTGDA